MVIVGLGEKSTLPKKLDHDETVKQCSAIGPYLVPDNLAYVQKAREPVSGQSTMLFGNMPRDGGRRCHVFSKEGGARVDDLLQVKPWR